MAACGCECERKQIAEWNADVVQVMTYCRERMRFHYVRSWLPMETTFANTICAADGFEFHCVLISNNMFPKARRKGTLSE